MLFPRNSLTQHLSATNESGSKFCGTNPENAVRISLNANIPVAAFEDALQRIANLLAEPPLGDPA